MRPSERSAQDPATRKNVLLQLAIAQRELPAYEDMDDDRRLRFRGNLEDQLHLGIVDDVAHIIEQHADTEGALVDTSLEMLSQLVALLERKWLTKCRTRLCTTGARWFSPSSSQ